MAQTKKAKKSDEKEYGQGSIIMLGDGRCRAKIGTDVLYTGNDIEIAKQKLEEARKERDLMNLIMQSPLKRLLHFTDTNSKWARMSLDEFAEHWFKHVWPKKRKQGKRISPKTIDSKQDAIKDIKKYIGHYSIGDITEDIIQQELIDVLVEKEYSLSFIEKRYQTINGIMKYAADELQCIERNPAVYVRIPVERIKPKKEIQWIKEHEIGALFQSCLAKYKNGKYIYTIGALFIFLLETGIRCSEARALVWTDVDWEKKRILICKQIVCVKGKDIPENYTKTANSTRWVYLNPVAIWALQLSRSLRYYGPNSPLFSTENKTLYSERNLHKTFNMILKRAGITPGGVHMLRHTFASILFHKNVRIEIISKLMGHKDTSVTSKIYIHFLREQQFEAIGEVCSVSESALDEAWNLIGNIA